MHVALRPGETLLPGTREALDAWFAKDDVDAVLLPLVPAGDHALARSARRYLAEWDRRFLHRMNFYAPASRVATRAPLEGHRNADAAPLLADTIARGRRVEALQEGGASTDIARDLDAWVRWALDEGAAWGALARRDARFRGFLPARSRAGWLKHNVWHATRRAGEIVEGTRRVDPLALMLHATREAAWTGAAVRALRL